MILLVNVFLVGNKSKSTYSRGNLSQDDKLEIFKYMLYSMSVIPWKKVFINYELDIEYGDEYQNINNLILTIFDGAIIKNKRNQFQSEWLETLKDIEEYRNEFIWLAQNDDHIFIDSDLNMLNMMIQEMKSLYSKNKYVTSIYSHWQESINRYYTDMYEYENINIFVIKPNEHIVADSIQIVSFELFEYWWTSEDYEDNWFPRTDPPARIKDKKIRSINSPYNVYSVIPKKEIVRHFDAYTHIKPEVPLNFVPPLEIPKGFFKKNMKLEYGYKNRKNDEAIVINPMINNYKAIDIRGVDYKFLLEEIPLFWKEHISRIDVNKKINEFENDLIYYRDLNVLKSLFWKLPKFISVEKCIIIFRKAFFNKNFKVKRIDKIKIYVYVLKNFTYRFLYKIYRKVY